MNRSAAAEKFGEIILWEQAIQIIARDFVKPGDSSSMSAPMSAVSR